MEDSAQPQGEVRNKGGWELKPEMIVGFIIAIIIIIFVVYAAATASPNSNNNTASNSPSPSTVAQLTSTPMLTEAPTVTPKPTLTPQQIIANFEKEAQTVSVADIYKTPNSYKQGVGPLGWRAHQDCETLPAGPWSPGSEPFAKTTHLV